MLYVTAYTFRYCLYGLCILHNEINRQNYIVVTTCVIAIKPIIHFNYSKLRIQFIIYLVYRTAWIKFFKLSFANSNGRAVWDVGLQSHACRFESFQWHVYPFLLRLYIYVSSWLLVQRSSTECGVFERDREASKVSRSCHTGGLFSPGGTRLNF